MNLPDPWIGPIYDTEKTERKIGRIAEYRVHPDYALKSTYYNDFLLVRLSSIETVEWEQEAEDDIPIDLPWLDNWNDRRRRTSQNTNGNQRLRVRTEHDGGRDRRNLEENDGFTYIRLNPDPSSPVDFSPLSVIGMGYDDSMDNSETLQHITDDSTFQKLPTPLCNQRNSYNGEIFEENMICAGTMEGVKDSCVGDSGGPLFYYDYLRGNKIPVQVGVTSWGNGCGRQNLPGIYSTVSSAYEWIRDVVCGDWKNKILPADADPDSEDWFLCEGYDDEKPRNQTGGIFSNNETTENNAFAIVCDETSEVSLEFHLTADAYGFDTYWELLSENVDEEFGGPSRIIGDQLFNDHETRLYRFCLPRPKQEEMVDSEVGESLDDLDSNMTEALEFERSYFTPSIDQRHCYTLNIHDRVQDGLGIQSRIPTAASGEKKTSVDPAGFAIRFGKAEAYENFGFPDFGGIATFSLCPAPPLETSSEESDIDILSEDTIIVVTEAPSQQPSEAPTFLPSASPSANATTETTFFNMPVVPPIMTNATEALSDLQPTTFPTILEPDTTLVITIAEETEGSLGLGLP